MTTSIKKKYTQQRHGFTLIELLVTIAIIGIISTLAVVNISNSRQKARDAKRISEMKEFIKALNLYYDDHQHYPDVENDGLDSEGEIIGDQDGLIEGLMLNYISHIPADPRYNDSVEIDDYFLAYDPEGVECYPVVSINRFEVTESLEKYGAIADPTNSNFHINTANFSYCFQSY